MPFGLINFVQGAGRAGRSSEVEATVLLIHNPRRTQSRAPTKKDDHTLIGAGQDFIATTECRRKPVSVEFNHSEDHERDCFDFQEHLLDPTFPPCDNCDSQEPVFPSLIQRLLRASRKDPKRGPTIPRTSLAGVSTPTASTSAIPTGANTITTPVYSTRAAILAQKITDYERTPVPGPSRLHAAPINDIDFFSASPSPIPSSTPLITDFIPSSSPFAPPISGVTPLQLANAQQSLGDVRKDQVIQLINTILQKFRKRCLVCYLHGHGLIEVEDDVPHHAAIWKTCLANCGSLKMNQMFQYKKAVNAIFKGNNEKYKVCYHCLLPQGRFIPEEHRPWEQGVNKPYDHVLTFSRTR